MLRFNEEGVNQKVIAGQIGLSKKLMSDMTLTPLPK